MSFKNTVLPVQTTLRSKGRLLDISKPIVMGILNATPDSFYDGGRLADSAAAAAHGERLLEQGADILDIGGESTRPRSEPVAEAAETDRRA